MSLPWTWPPLISATGGGNTDAYRGGPMLGTVGSDPSWDLEARTLTDPDITKTGWIVQLQGPPYTLLSFNGPPDLSQPGAPVGTFNAELVAGVLVMQGPGMGGPIQIYRAADGLAHSYVSHVWTEDYQNGNADYTFISDHPNFLTNGTTFFYGGLEQPADRHMVIVKVLGTANPNAPIVTLYANQPVPVSQQEQVRYIRDRATSLQTEVRFYQPNGQLIEANPIAVDGIAPASFMGVWLNATFNHFFYVDYIRRQPINQYP